MKVASTLFFLWIAHLCMDFFVGIWPIYKTITQLDIAAAGLIMGISGFCGEILQIFFGYLCDRGYRKYILLAGIILASAILTITCTTQLFPCFLILMIMMIGSGAFHPAAAGMASSLSQEHKGKMVLIFASGGTIGLGISQLTFLKIFETFNGHVAILYVPICLLLIALIIHRFPTQIHSHRLPLKSFFSPIMHQKKPLMLLYFSQVAIWALTASIYFLLPDLLQAKNCHSWICLGGGHLCFVLGSALIMIPTGYLCDRIGQKFVLLSALGAAICLFYVFLMQEGLSPFSTMALLAGLGAFVGVINPIIVSWGNRLVPESPSTVSALLMGCAWCVGNLGPALMGFITQMFDENPYTKTLLFSGVLFLVVFICISCMPKVTHAPVDITLRETKS